jgi:hypothetical protein
LGIQDARGLTNSFPGVTPHWVDADDATDYGSTLSTELLNRLGQDGWEVCAFDVSLAGRTLLLKRAWGAGWVRINTELSHHPITGSSAAEPTAEADRSRHPGFSTFNVFAGGPGSLAERYAVIGRRGICLIPVRPHEVMHE